MKRWTPIITTLLLLVVLVSMAGVVQGEIYPTEFELNEGIQIGGTFPPSIRTSDNDHLQIQSQGAGVEYIKFDVEFELNQKENTRIVWEVRSSWTLISSCTACYVVSVYNGNTWRIVDYVLWDTDTVRSYDLTDMEAGQNPIQMRLYQEELDITFVFIDHLYIETWEEGDVVPDEPPVVPPDDDEEEDDELWEFDWLLILYTIIIVILVFTLSWKVSGSIPVAIVVGTLVGILFFLFMSGLIWTLLIPGVVR